MERYVWELSRELARRGVAVVVLCEKCQETQYGLNIRVLEIGTSCVPSNWLRLAIFGFRVSKMIHKLNFKNFIIHSHERTSLHHVTTFHGSVFANILSQNFLKRLSIRVLSFLYMERREVCGPTVQFVIPNSEVTRISLETFYQCISTRMGPIITPGVFMARRRVSRSLPSDAGVIGFVGKEWRRKGLLRFLEIVRHLSRKRPALKAMIFGPERQHIQHLIKDLSHVISFCGWTDSTPNYPSLDLLAHPAHDEAYGMCVAEAMAAGVPVVVSSASGVSKDVSELNGSVLDIDQPLQDWVSACEYWLRITEEPPAYKRSWATVADEYIAVYKRVKL